MKVLITGATGLIGQAIVKELHRQEVSVNYLTTSKDKLENSDNYQGFYWNPEKNEIDLACFQGVDGVINLAGATIAKRWTTSYKKIILESRLKSLETLHEAISKLQNHSIQSFISASAIGIYPNSLTHYYDEKEQAVDDSFLGTVVEQWETAADTFKSFGFPVAKIRIGLVLSTEGGALPRMAAPIKNYVGAPIGSGEQWQSWIHIDDLAQIFVHVLQNGLSGIFNGVSPNPVTNSKLTKEIATVLDKPLWLPNVPKFALKFIFGKMAYLLFASQRVSSKKIEKQGFSFLYSNLSLALEDLYNPNKAGVQTSSDIKNELV